MSETPDDFDDIMNRVRLQLDTAEDAPALQDDEEPEAVPGMAERGAAFDAPVEAIDMQEPGPEAVAEVAAPESDPVSDAAPEEDATGPEFVELAAETVSEPLPQAAESLPAEIITDGSHSAGPSLTGATEDEVPPVEAPRFDPPAVVVAEAEPEPVGAPEPADVTDKGTEAEALADESPEEMAAPVPESGASDDPDPQPEAAPVGEDGPDVPSAAEPSVPEAVALTPEAPIPEVAVIAEPDTEEPAEAIRPQEVEAMSPLAVTDADAVDETTPPAPDPTADTNAEAAISKVLASEDPEMAGILGALAKEEPLEFAGPPKPKRMARPEPPLPPADFRRRVFYIPGYDPGHPRRYRELYRKESQAQAELSGYRVQMRRREPGSAAHNWQARGSFDGTEVDARFEVLTWSDLARTAMNPTISGTYWQMLRTAWIYLSTGTLRRLTWLSKGPVIAALYPVGVLLLQLLLAMIAGIVAGRLLAWPVGLLAGLAGFGEVFLPRAVFWTTALPVALYALRWFQSKDDKLLAYRLMHDYAYSAQLRGANPLPLEERMEAFGKEIAEALRSDVDEVLVIGHSAGAHLAISVVADLLRIRAARRTGPELSLLTLGQVVPMVSFLPNATRLRSDLAYLSTRRDLTWIDVTAPDDGCSFALSDPVAVSGVQPEGAIWPKVISADFSRTLQPETLERLDRRYLQLHRQYLCAFDRLSGQSWDYDYFRITAGPETLGERFAERPPARSRIDVPASKFTSRAA